MDRLNLHHILCPWGRQRQEAGAGGEIVRASWICVGPLPGGGGGVRSEVGTGGRAVEGNAQDPGRWRERVAVSGHSPSREWGQRGRLFTRQRATGVTSLTGSHSYLLCFDREVGRLHQGNRGHQHAPGVRADPVQQQIR